MDKKEEFVKKIFIGIFLLMIAYNVFLFFYSPEVSVTGYDTSSQGIVSFAILGTGDFTILHPENKTYNYSNTGPFIMELNGTSTGPMDRWDYSVFDLKHNRYYVQDYSFGYPGSYFPNTTFPVVRWGNRVEVTAELTGQIITKNVTFYVNVPNSAPVLGPIDDPIYKCEGNSLVYYFNATDVDETDLFHSIVDPSGHFDINFEGRDEQINYFVLFSDPALKGIMISLDEGRRVYPLTIEVSDHNSSTCCSDFAATDVIVIERNNPPRIIPNLTTRTIWNKGDNASLYIDVNFSDTETRIGNWPLYPSFNLTNKSDGSVVNLFGMDSNGIINFTANETTPLGVYNATVCVTDTGLSSPDSMIQEVCNQDGNAITTCDSFELTITDENRPPTIVETYPDSSLQVNTTSLVGVYFNATEYDPDGTTPDGYWFVDNNFVEMDEGSLVDEFSYTFGCGIGGMHKVELEITDGELNDSVEWNVSVSLIACAEDKDDGGGGGGGGGGPSCETQWACTPWSICQNALSSLNLGLISGNNYRFISDSCDEVYFGEDRCGYQVRTCRDVNFCNTTWDKPEELQYCLYTADPTCKDGIQNCHDGSCELLIDCGGPCEPCASCSDGIKNQGEEGVDCGGPCPWKCKPDVPLLKRSKTIYVFLIILLIIIILIVIKLIRVLKYHKAIESNKKPNV